MASQDQDLKNAANAAKGTVETAQTAKKVVKVAKLASTAAKGASGPAGWVMLAMELKPYLDKAKRFMRKMQLAAGAGLLYLLLQLLQYAFKFLGALAGLTFGAITGLPLLVIPVVGPFLYAGWVGYWTIRGWIDPAATIHLATHPWEAITQPLSKAASFANSVIATPVNVTVGISSAAAGAVSSIGNFIAGTASTIWNGAVSIGGGLLSGVSSITSSVISGLSSATPAIAGSLASTGVYTGLGLTIGGGYLIYQTTAASFFSPQKDAAIGGSGDNEFFTIQKTASVSKVPNALLPEDISYTITLTAKANLTNITLTDKVQVQGENGNFDLTQDKNGDPLPPCPSPQTLLSGQEWTCEFTITAISSGEGDFTDSVVTNRVSATATPGGQAPFTDSSFALTAVGTPPTDCPSGWPMDHGRITQGPLGVTSHLSLVQRYGESAIDIGDNPRGTPTFATFAGDVAYVTNDDWGGGYGKHVDVRGVCGGTVFVARWAHLNSIDSSMRVGSRIQFGQRIGGIDSTGKSGGDHLHYSLQGLNISDYVPVPIEPLSCEEGVVSCNISW